MPQAAGCCTPSRGTSFRSRLLRSCRTARMLLRRRGPGTQAVGCRKRPAAADLRGDLRFGRVCGVLARWHTLAVGRRRPHPQAVGCRKRPAGPHLRGACPLAGSVAFSPDGTRLLSGSDDQTLKLWDAASGQVIQHAEPPFARSGRWRFRPTAPACCLASAKTINLWDASSGQLIRTFEAHTSSVKSVAFSPDGARLLTGGNIGFSGDQTLKLWDTANGATDTRLGGASRRRQRRLRSRPTARACCRAVTVDKTLKLWDAASGQVLRTFDGHSGPSRRGAFRPTARALLSGSWDKTLKLWDAASGQMIRTFEGHSGWVKSVAFSPDGMRVLSGSSDSTARIWSTASGQLWPACPARQMAGG